MLNRIRNSPLEGRGKMEDWRVADDRRSNDLVTFDTSRKAHLSYTRGKYSIAPAVKALRISSYSQPNIVQSEFLPQSYKGLFDY